MFIGKMLTCKLLVAAAFGMCFEGHATEFKVLTRAEPVVRMVLQEANNEPFAGMVAVAGVAFDRVSDPRWPADKEAVVRQPYQFEGMSVKLRRYGKSHITRARDAVTSAQAGDRPCGRVLWFHTTDVKPDWDYSKIEVACQIGGHIFYRDRR